ncbi:MAG TPA: hypothetical protein VK421_06275 [Pyrinomonadaceae bacterium]|nr:hypothetical protein [Pyrinomonadaceae bacterium]
MDKWQTRRILILGTTYPSHSQKYTETVCTGGLFEDTLQMCRLHPVPQRYLEAQHRVHKFQWITARVMKHDTDPRPESYRIDPQSIEPQEKLSDHDERRRLLEESPNLCRSVEELFEHYEGHGMSLGIVVPESILDCSVEMRRESEREAWQNKERARALQERLFGEKPKPLAFPEAQFFVRWKCQEPDCPTHNMSILQWGIHELYRKYNDPEVAKEKVLQKMRQELNEGEKDIFLFLGNFRTIMYNFGLMDSYSAPARAANKDQFSLFR